MPPSLALPVRSGGQFAGYSAELDALLEQLAHRPSAIGLKLGQADALVAPPQAVAVLSRTCGLAGRSLAHAGKRYAAGLTTRGRYTPQHPDQPHVPDRVRELRPPRRLQVGQQVEFAAVVGPMATAPEV